MTRIERRFTHHIGKLEARVLAAELGDAAHTTRADHAPLGHLVEASVRQSLLDDEGVARVLALEDGAELAAGRELGRDVLERVHDRVDLAAQERNLELLGPERCGGMLFSILNERLSLNILDPPLPPKV